MNGRPRLAVWLVSAMVGLAGCASGPDAPPGVSGLDRIEHIVVIYAENHSFDNLYGLFPGANGIANATVEQKTQLDHDGTPLPSLTVWGADGKADPRFPRLPNGPFRIDAPPIAMGLDRIVPSPIHAFYHNQEQINHGKNNMFAAMSQVGGWVMGHYDGSQMSSGSGPASTRWPTTSSWGPSAARTSTTSGSCARAPRGIPMLRHPRGRSSTKKAG